MAIAIATHIAFKAKTYTRYNLDFGKAAGCLIEFLSATDAETAAATCRFAIQGPRSVGTKQSGKNWGEWIRTRIQSWAKPNNDVWQSHPNGWFSGDGHSNANALLACFDLSLEDVFAEWGRPVKGQRYYLTLQEIVERLQPTLVGEANGK